MRTVLLIRHAKAGDRTASGQDHLRELTTKGHQQAKKLAEHLAELPVTEIRSSPAVRCVQTVQPLAEKLSLDLIEDPDLMEGQPIDLPDEEGVFVWCAHGDNIPALLAEIGVECHACKKGSCWLLRYNDDEELIDVVYAETSAD